MFLKIKLLSFAFIFLIANGYSASSQNNASSRYQVSLITGYSLTPNNSKTSYNHLDFASYVDGQRGQDYIHYGLAFHIPLVNNIWASTQLLMVEESVGSFILSIEYQKNEKFGFKTGISYQDFWIKDFCNDPSLPLNQFYANVNSSKNIVDKGFMVGSYLKNSFGRFEILGKLNVGYSFSEPLTTSIFLKKKDSNERQEYSYSIKTKNNIFLLPGFDLKLKAIEFKTFAIGFKLQVSSYYSLGRFRYDLAKGLFVQDNIISSEPIKSRFSLAQKLHISIGIVYWN